MDHLCGPPSRPRTKPVRLDQTSLPSTLVRKTLPQTSTGGMSKSKRGLVLTNNPQMTLSAPLQTVLSWISRNRLWCLRTLAPPSKLLSTARHPSMDQTFVLCNSICTHRPSTTSMMNIFRLKCTWCTRVSVSSCVHKFHCSKLIPCPVDNTQLAVIALMFQVSASDSDPIIAGLSSSLEAIASPGTKTTIEDGLDFSSVLSKIQTSDILQYSGSLTTPPAPKASPSWWSRTLLMSALQTSMRSRRLSSSTRVSSRTRWVDRTCWELPGALVLLLQIPRHEYKVKTGVVRNVVASVCGVVVSCRAASVLCWSR